MSSALPDGTALPSGWALQDASDYEEAAAAILGALGRGRTVRGIGLGFTASSPLPATADGTPLSRLHPARRTPTSSCGSTRPRRRRRIGSARAGGTTSPTSAGACPPTACSPRRPRWPRRRRPSGPRRIASSRRATGWPGGSPAARRAAPPSRPTRPIGGWRSAIRPMLVPGLGDKLGEVRPVGTAAGALTPAWRERTGIGGEAVVAVPVIDSHSRRAQPRARSRAGRWWRRSARRRSTCCSTTSGARCRPGSRGGRFGGVVPGLWCHEAGQAAFGDALGWFVRAFPRGAGVEDSFAAYDAAAAALAPGEAGVVALDWWNGNRVPHGDARLSGLFAGMTLRTTAVDLYRALLESLCFGARAIVDRFVDGGVPVERVVMTSGLSLANPLLMQDHGRRARPRCRRAPRGAAHGRRGRDPRGREPAASRGTTARRRGASGRGTRSCTGRTRRRGSATTRCTAPIGRSATPPRRGTPCWRSAPRSLTRSCSRSRR